MDKKHFFIRLIPPRVTFTEDMTDEELETMQKEFKDLHDKLTHHITRRRQGKHRP